jgi:hypothetical protein
MGGWAGRLLDTGQARLSFEDAVTSGGTYRKCSTTRFSGRHGVDVEVAVDRFVPRDRSRCSCRFGLGNSYYSADHCNWMALQQFKICLTPTS